MIRPKVSPGSLLWVTLLLPAVLMPLSCSPSERTVKTVNVDVETVPSVVYADPQGIYVEPSSALEGAHSFNQNLTWLFHLVFVSHEDRPLRFERAKVLFKSEGEVLWEESFSRKYLERMEWIEGSFEHSTEYYFSNLEYVGNDIVSLEKAVDPDLASGASVSWVRIPFVRPWFAQIDQIDFLFRLTDAQGEVGALSHSVPIVSYHQKVKLFLPFFGVWALNQANDLASGHRSMGVNGVTTYGWDFGKLGGNGLPYRTDGKTPEDYYAYGETVLAAGDGEVVHVRNDIAEFGVGKLPPLEALIEDTDVLAGNLVIIDHGNSEYSLTCHLQPGSITVKKGDQVKAGQVIGKVGESGNIHFPDFHFHLMDGAQWLEAKGLPAVFSDFELIRPAELPQKVDLGNPMGGWLVRRVSQTDG